MCDIFCDWLLSLKILLLRFVHVIAYTSTSFLSTVEWYSIVWLYYILFIQSLISRHLRCFHFLAIINNTAINICGQVFMWSYFFLLAVYIGVEFPGHVLTLCLTLWRIARLFSKVAIPVYNLAYTAWSFQFLHILANFCYHLSFWLYIYPYGYAVVSWFFFLFGLMVWHVGLVSWPGIKPASPAVEAVCLNHRTARGVPLLWWFWCTFP